jgi:hypothetical protein
MLLSCNDFSAPCAGANPKHVPATFLVAAGMAHIPPGTPLVLRGRAQFSRFDVLGTGVVPPMFDSGRSRTAGHRIFIPRMPTRRCRRSSRLARTVVLPVAAAAAAAVAYLTTAGDTPARGRHPRRHSRLPAAADRDRRNRHTLGAHHLTDGIHRRTARRPHPPHDHGFGCCDAAIRACNPRRSACRA